MMPIGIIGTGKIGTAIGRRLLRASFRLVAFDANHTAVTELRQRGAQILASIEQVAQSARTIWLLVPHEMVQQVFDRICMTAAPGTIIIDAGNSYYQEAVMRSEKAQKNGLIFLDCGTSGGIVGLEKGFCLMVGGERVAYHQIEQQLQAIAAPESYAYVGASGAGHYTKMVHNAIEYGMLQAYAEGFALLKECPNRTASLQHIAKLWQSAALIKSSLLEFYAYAVTDLEQVDASSGILEQGGTAGWALQEALANSIDTPVLRSAILVRTQSKNGSVSFITRLISRVRNLFGGHAWR